MTRFIPVKHLLATSVLLSACAAGASPAMAPMAPTAQGAVAHMEPESVATSSQPQLVVEGSIGARVSDVRAVAEELRSSLTSWGGHLASESTRAHQATWRTDIEVRIPAAQLPALEQFLKERGEIVSKNLRSEDVSRQLMDQELALENLRITMARLQGLMDRGDLDMQAVLAIEKELTRVRGEIEAIQGQQRYLRDRVALARVSVHLDSTTTSARRPGTKFFIGPEVGTLSLWNPEGRSRHRLGYGLRLGLPETPVDYSFLIYQARADGKRPYEITMGMKTYSDHLPGIDSRWLKPYLGLRMGYGSLSGANFLIAGEAGLRVADLDWAQFDVFARASSFIGKGGPDAAGSAGAQVSLSF